MPKTKEDLKSPRGIKIKRKESPPAHLAMNPIPVMPARASLGGPFSVVKKQSPGSHASCAPLLVCDAYSPYRPSDLDRRDPKMEETRPKSPIYVVCICLYPPSPSNVCRRRIYPASITQNA